MIKKICFHNTDEITFHAFHEYCISIEIEVEHLVAHVHTQNRLAKSLLKHLKLVARSLFMRANLPMATWGYAILHVIDSHQTNKLSQIFYCAVGFWLIT